MNTLILIDGRNFCYRHLHTHRYLSSKGRPTGLLYGALVGICRLHRIHPGARFVFCWDGDKAKTESWRNGIYKAYKANRLKPKSPGDQNFLFKEVVNQIPKLEKFLDQLGFQQIKIDELEADDVIGILATHASGFCDKVIVYSTDRDFYQLINDKICVVRDTDKTKDCRPVKIKEIKSEYGVGPKHWLRYRALVGDPGDNIIKDKAMKVGHKTAVKLIAAGMNASQKRYSFSDPKYKQFWKTIRLNYRLSKILRTIESVELKHCHSTRKSLDQVLRRFKCFGDLQRATSGRSKAAYNTMIKFFAEYEMEEMLKRRNDLWKIQ